MNIKVLLQAFNHPWLIHPDSAQHYALIAHKLFTSEKASWFDDDEEETKEFAWIVNTSGNRIGSIEDAVSNGIAVINMQGAVMKYDYCGAPGTQSMMKALQQANDNPSVSAIVLQIDSPGGSVDGTQQFADAVKNSAKPVVAYVNGMMASAAMWIGSAASQRIASSNLDVVGSIGTMAKWMDFKGYYEKLGIKQHEVYATDSTHKNDGFRQAESGDYAPLIKTWLDPFNNEFLGAIKQNLPGADKSVLTGAHFIAKDGMKKGLVDKIANFETAVKTAMKLGKEQKHSIDKNMNIKSTFKNILGFLGVKNEANAETVELSEEQLQKIEAALPQLEQANTKIGELETAATESAAKVTALETEKTQLNTKVTELQAEVTRLGELDAGGKPKPKAEGDRQPDADDKAEYSEQQKQLFAKAE